MSFTGKKIIIYTDGGSRGNPGTAGAGWVIADENKAPLKKGSAALGTQTNNWAEYEAIIRAFADLKKLVPKNDRGSVQVELRLDSELAAKQLSDEYQIKDEPLQLQYMKVHNIRVSEFPNVTVTHIPREENSLADGLANVAMDGGEQRALL